ncbi:MAG: M14 family zinc carboxypeptidase, partial [Mycobacterium leprae]
MSASTAAERIAAFEEPGYLGYDELTLLVQAFAEAYPTLVRCRSIGQSPEGREIWLLTIAGGGGTDVEKRPAILIEGNIHAGEVTASSAALYTAKRLLEGYGQNKAI